MGLRFHFFPAEESKDYDYISFTNKLRNGIVVQGAFSFFPLSHWGCDWQLNTVDTSNEYMGRVYSHYYYFSLLMPTMRFNITFFRFKPNRNA